MSTLVENALVKFDDFSIFSVATAGIADAIVFFRPAVHPAAARQFAPIADFPGGIAGWSAWLVCCGIVGDHADNANHGSHGVNSIASGHIPAVATGS